jgi:hypothetical protein
MSSGFKNGQTVVRLPERCQITKKSTKSFGTKIYTRCKNIEFKICAVFSESTF